MLLCDVPEKMLFTLRQQRNAIKGLPVVESRAPDGVRAWCALTAVVVMKFYDRCTLRLFTVVVRDGRRSLTMLLLL